jgi:hypothetical protein
MPVTQKKIDFFNDIIEMRNNEGKITFATELQAIPKGILEDEEDQENMDL